MPITYTQKKEWKNYYYKSTSDNETINLIEEIHSTEHGTVGSSIKDLSAACKFIQLARSDASLLECVHQHLNSMT